ncbi:MAG: hypothetical protein QOI39_727 [Mycobacterium sp.]|jgi:hypothetical protein|nr:hypothetical protein [Mycobacterium sp.]
MVVTIAPLLPWGVAQTTAATATIAPRPGIGTSFSRPTMVDPITIALHVASDSLVLNDSRDYILKMPSQKKTGPLVIQGGRNIEIIGGYMSTKVKGPNIVIWDDANVQPGRIVHIEGLLIDGSSGVQSDGIVIKAPKTIVQVENCRVVDLIGKLSGYHADVIQPFGGVMELRIDGLSAASHYNNLYLRRESSPLGPTIGKVVIRNSNFWGYKNSYTPSETLRAISLGTQADPPSDDSQAIDCKITSPVVLTSVYAAPPSGKRLGQFVYPHDSMGGAASYCSAVVSADGMSADWPALRASNGGQITGKVLLGPPPGGDFVPVGVAGIGYRG